MNRLEFKKVSFVGNPRSEDAIVEVPVLLEARLLKALESAARTRDMTAGALVRCLLRDFLCYSDSNAPIRIAEKESNKAFQC